MIVFPNHNKFSLSNTIYLNYIDIIKYDSSNNTFLYEFTTPNITKTPI